MPDPHAGGTECHAEIARTQVYLGRQDDPQGSQSYGYLRTVRPQKLLQNPDRTPVSKRGFTVLPLQVRLNDKAVGNVRFYRTLSDHVNYASRLAGHKSKNFYKSFLRLSWKEKREILVGGGNGISHHFGEHPTHSGKQYSHVRMV